jgi:Beta-propeller repeat
MAQFKRNSAEKPRCVLTSTVWMLQESTVGRLQELLERPMMICRYALRFWLPFTISILLFSTVSSINPCHAQSMPSSIEGAGMQLPIPAQPNVDPRVGKIPLSFEPNAGQTGASVKFTSHAPGYQLYLTDYGATIAFVHDAKSTLRPTKRLPGAPNRWPILHPSTGGRNTEGKTSIVRMELTGGSREAAIRGELPLPGKVNYITGNDRSKWHTGLESYARVRYSRVYPGVDLVYYGDPNRLEYDFEVGPEADAGQIRMHFSGADKLRLNRDGDLLLDDSISFHRPSVYQQSNGVRHPVEGKFHLISEDTVGFVLGAYDHTKPLVIDPVLSYSTYLGGEVLDVIQALAVDQAGNAYVTGTTSSCKFPTTPGSYAPSLPVCSEQGIIFVSKLNPQGTGLVYSTFLATDDISGHDLSHGWAIAVDSSGSAYIAGQAAGGLPVTPGAFQPVNNAASNQGINGFVLKLNPQGSGLIYSTYLGGSYGADAALAIAVDVSGNAYVAGTAVSPDFPVTSGAFQTTDLAPGDPFSFVTKLNPTGSALIYSTYLMGTQPDKTEWGAIGQANGIAVDAGGNAYVVGATADEAFPISQGAFQGNYSPNPILISYRFTGYVTKLDPTGSRAVYASYLGGNYMTAAQAVAVDSSGAAYVTGWTEGGMTTTSGAFQTVAPGYDAFVVKVNPAGTALSYATYLGGSYQIAFESGGGTDPFTLAGDSGNAISIDPQGNAYVAGLARSSDFPTTTNAIQTSLPNNGSPSMAVFFSELDSTGSKLLYSTYLGGSYGGDTAWGIGLDGAKNVYLGGFVHSMDFPTTSGAFQTTNNAPEGTGFVSKLTVPLGGQVFMHDFALVTSPSSVTITRGQPTTSTITVTPSNGFYESINFTCSGVPTWANCSFSNTDLFASSGPATTTLMVGTLAPVSMKRQPYFPIAPVLSAAALIGLWSRRRQRSILMLIPIIMFMGIGLLNGCGSGGSGGTGSGGGGGGNQSNTFTVTVTGTAASVKHTATFTVTAN